MRNAASHSALLSRGRLLRVHARPGSRMHCERGMVWLTQENDPVDRILAAGESFCFDRPGIALVNALGCDAALAFSSGTCWNHADTSIGEAAPISVGEEIGRICTRCDPRLLAQLSPGARAEAVEREARRMRAQVLWLLLQHVRRGLIAAVTRASSLGRKALCQARRPAAHKGQSVGTQQGY